MSIRTIALYGEPKCGKTDVAIALAGGSGEVHYISYDRRSVADTAEGMGITVENIHEARNINELVKALRSIPDDATVVCDELSLIFKVKLGALGKEHSDNGMKMYPALERTVIAFMEMVRKRAGITIMTLWEQNPKEQKLSSGDTKIVIGKPGVPGVNAANTFAGMCDLILRLKSQDGSDAELWPWEFQVVPDEMYMAGGRGVEGFPAVLPLSIRSIVRKLGGTPPELFEGHNDLIDALAPLLGDKANKSAAGKLIKASKMPMKTLRVVLADAKCKAALEDTEGAQALALMAGAF